MVLKFDLIDLICILASENHSTAVRIIYRPSNLLDYRFYSTYVSVAIY